MVSLVDSLHHHHYANDDIFRLSLKYLLRFFDASVDDEIFGRNAKVFVNKKLLLVVPLAIFEMYCEFCCHTSDMSKKFKSDKNLFF